MVVLGDFFADNDFDGICDFSESFCGEISYEAATIKQSAGGNVAAMSGLSCYAFVAFRCNNLFGSSVGGNDDDGVDDGFDCGCSQPVPDLTEILDNLVLLTGMASKLSIINLVQVQIDGLDLCGQDIYECPFGFYCTVIAVQPEPVLPSASVKSQLAMCWNLQKGAEETIRQ